MQTLYVMMGAPGSGKSTFAKTNLMDSNTIYVSRDVIRFAKLETGQAYFSNESQVFREYISQINKGLAVGHNVIADATHLNPPSRYKLFRMLRYNRSAIRVIIVHLNTPIDTCLIQNGYRKGTQAFVPEPAVRAMNRSIQAPTAAEPNINEYWVVEEGEVKSKTIFR